MVHEGGAVALAEVGVAATVETKGAAAGGASAEVDAVAVLVFLSVEVAKGDHSLRVPTEELHCVMMVAMAAVDPRNAVSAVVGIVAVGAAILSVVGATLTSLRRMLQHLKN